MAARTIHGSAGLKEVVGEHLGYSDWMEITQERVNRFAEATGDFQWIHIDPERAKKESPFGGPIAHGYLTLSLAPTLLPLVVQTTGFKMGVNYGCNKVRFMSPVPVGANLRLGVKLLSVDDIAGGVQSTYELTFECEGAAKPSCVAEVIYRSYEQPMNAQDDHVAIVTGANHGIGAATAQRFAADGIAVVVTYLRGRVTSDPATPERYQENRMMSGDAVASRITEAGGRAIAIEANLLDISTPAMLFDHAEAEFGPVDIVVNNATGWHSGDSFAAGGPDPAGRATPEVTAELFDRTFGVDARAGALMIAEFARRLIARGGNWGRIVGLTSGGPNGFPGEVTYGAAKVALENYTMAAATELGRRGVTANMIHPPITDSGWVNDGVREFAATSTEHFHVAEPSEVAAVIAWLCTDEARMVTGNVIRMR